MRQAQQVVDKGHITLISVGSNVPSNWGDPRESVRRAAHFLQTSLGVDVVASRFYATPAFPAGAGPDFVNGVFALHTDRSPTAVMAVLHDIEAQAGRERRQRWGPRVLDLDLLACGTSILPDAKVWRAWHDLDTQAQTEVAPDQLILPHPRIQDRAFVLVPMADVAPDWVHPVLGLSVVQMLERCAPDDVASVVPLR